MDKRLAACTATILLACLAMAQPTANQHIALSKDVRHGQLDNGLTYYLRHNPVPQRCVELHIVQKVSSILEEEELRGLAHFLEHMAFNGTKNFPGKSLIGYLEQNKIGFVSPVRRYEAYLVKERQSNQDFH